jgi:hypothetical protein
VAIKTIKVDLGEGDSAELYEEVTHGTSRRVQDIYRPFLTKPEVMKALETGTEEERLAKLYELIAPTADVTGAADALIIGQVKEWTIGGQALPVTQATLDGLPERKRETLVQEANKLYGSIPLAVTGAGK